jgi:hypothetical protein
MAARLMQGVTAKNAEASDRGKRLKNRLVAQNLAKSNTLGDFFASKRLIKKSKQVLCITFSQA